MNQIPIVMIAFWSGTYPWYFPYFVHSCQFNPTIDFVIISDNTDTVLNLPDNLKIIHKTLQEMEDIASQKLGFSAAIKHAYKLNDFKPAYGYIFSEIVSGYDFGGHMDLDIILGNLREFLTNEMLSTYDFISVRHDYTAGCFCLYKNTEKINKLFMLNIDYKLVLSTPKHYCFDECNFAWDFLMIGKSIIDLHTEIESFTEVAKKAELSGYIKAHFDFILMEGITGRIVFDHGRIIYKNQFEAILYHLFWLKKVYSPTKNINKIPDKYYISPTRIYHSRSKPVLKQADVK
jgi:hypothetical protein